MPPPAASMKQWISAQDGIPQLKLEEATTAPTAADLGDGDVLVQMGSVALNYRDVEGMYLYVYVR